MLNAITAASRFGKLTGSLCASSAKSGQDLYRYNGHQRRRASATRSTATATATERINSQAKELGIKRPKLRNRASITNHNTLIYVLINLHALQRIRQRKAARSARTDNASH